MAHTQKQFGFQAAAAEERDDKVQGVFSSVASRYDLMNDLMSGGLHRLWKDRMVSEVRARPSQRVLDVAGGTGDIAFRISQKTGAQVTVCDRNPEMLEVGRGRAIDRGINNLTWQEGDAQKLPFEDNSFDFYTISFGLRNVTRLSDGLSEAYRVLKPGGKFLCLEFSPDVGPEAIRKIYDLFSFKIVPRMGELVTGDRDSYQYLVESIRVFPQPKELLKIMGEVGFRRTRVVRMTFGVVCLHIGYKI